MSDSIVSADSQPRSLHRHFGLLQATALNVTMIVGAGIFVTIPLMLKELPGPYALLGWIVAGVLILVDSLIWSELAALMPGSGGSYLYLLESYGPKRWGRLMAFLFIWQFLISGPLELASGLISMGQFATALHETLPEFVERWTWSLKLGTLARNDVTFSAGPKTLFSLGVGGLLLFLLYRRITALGRLTVTFWLGVLGAIVWILLEGWWRFDSSVAFDVSRTADHSPENFGWALGGAMILAIYSYLGYYNVCYIGDEVRNPERTIPRSILLSALLVCVLFAGVHLALLGTISWRSIPTKAPDIDNYSLAAAFMQRIHGNWAVKLITLCLLWSCLGSAFAGMLGYSRILYGAARYGHFFRVFARVHPVHHIPHVALMLIGVLTCCWCFFDLQNVINALITTRILEQFIGQIVGVVLLRIKQPERSRPFRIWLYPVPCGLALIGWLYLYIAAGWLFIGLGLATLAGGVGMFLLWAKTTEDWPFGDRPIGEES